MSRAARSSLVDHVLDALAPLGPVETPRFFGGTGLRSQGVMFGFVIRERLYLRVDGRSSERYRALGSQPFRYATKRGEVEVGTFYEVPPDALEMPEDMCEFAQEAIAAARAAGDRR